MRTKVGNKAPILLALALLAALGVAMWEAPTREWSLSFIRYVKNLGLVGFLLYALAYVVGTVLLFPATLLTLGSGFLYGPVWGTVLVSPASVAGATMAFILSRSFAREWIAEKVQKYPRFAAIDRAVGRRSFKTVLLLRLQPINLPFALLNYALGLTSVRLRDYVLASWLGMLPATILYVYAGSVVRDIAIVTRGGFSTSWQRLLFWGGLVATAGLVVFLTRLARRALEEEMDKSEVTVGQEGRHKMASMHRLLAPDDVYNRELLQNAHPPAWINPKPHHVYNLVVLGAGTAGLVATAGAAALGARVALVEKLFMGGDCLNFGCVPSKAVIRASRAAYALMEACEYGGNAAGTVTFDFSRAMERMRRLRAEISSHDSVQRFTSLGAQIFLGAARFTSRGTVDVDGIQLRFKKAIIATGGRPARPDIPGLAEAGFLTNETVFSLTELPARLVVVGAGPIGCELAQAFQRLGSQVTILTRGSRSLPREDPDVSSLLTKRFEIEGIRVVFGANIRRVERENGDKVIHFVRGTVEEEAAGTEILVSVGRVPNIEGLNLEAAGVEYDAKGVRVDDRLCTTNPNVYAAGDICSPFKFTHAAEAMARIALQNALFFGRKKASSLVIPWTTYTDPEVAHVGLAEQEARNRGYRVETFTLPLAEVDRAILDGETEGFARVHMDAKTKRILGATLVSRHSGESIGELVLAMNRRLRLDALSGVIHPYPTQAEVIKRLGDASMRSRLKPWMRRLLERYFRYRR